MNLEAYNKIVEMLKQNNFNNELNMLENLFSQYNSTSKENKPEIGKKIKDMCNPRWLGDLYVKGISLKEWYGLLDKLSKSV